MNKSQIKEKLENAVKNLFQNQPDIFDYTPETRITEWNLAHHLAFEIQKEFPDYQHDIELIKSSAGDKRPDIVLHTRGTHKNNFLVIEVKRQRNTRSDRDKIEENWFIDPYYYEFGATIQLIDINKYHIEVFKNNMV
ncbi:MAG: hypothetical protein ACFFCV_06415 [Promethearchaeota archaeon]